jgi:hypothetical protein
MRSLVDAEALAPSNVSATAETLNSPSQRSDAPPVKLPDISIPKFNGLFTEWIGFRDSFTSLIHENASLSAIQKFHYLKGSLTGDASQIIAHLAPSMNNYASEWQLIQQRYGIMFGPYFLCRKVVTKISKCLDNCWTRSLRTLKR